MVSKSQVQQFRKSARNRIIGKSPTVFKEIVANLKTLEVKYDEEDLALIILCSLPTSFSSFSDMILYSRDTITIEKVYDALFSKEKMKHLVSDVRDGEGLVAHGGSERDISKSSVIRFITFARRNGT
ncbi:unnamed protein product [Fraxinus pennsylvanica]|uniref:Retrovirus-related Pol polyprotein from transposon TNT 1-94 n=1 Tax=Fraxinus pennsylvanica TaxID=56036 RepID=A0AAD2AI38_9LAMI|nr:unnamed protein product [Fraxinus pennsylvanica]